MKMIFNVIQLDTQKTPVVLELTEAEKQIIANHKGNRIVFQPQCFTKEQMDEFIEMANEVERREKMADEIIIRR